MNEITINPRPEMCKFIVQHINLLKNNPVLIADVGSRYGYNPVWEAFDLCMKAICFEPDIEECALLNSMNNPKAQFIPTLSPGSSSSRKERLAGVNRKTYILLICL